MVTGNFELKKGSIGIHTNEIGAQNMLLVIISFFVDYQA